MKRFALLMFVLTLLAPQAWVLGASYEDPKGPKRPKDSAPAAKKKAIAVFEPTTITLLGAAAGVAGARKLWRNRQRKLEPS